MMFLHQRSFHRNKLATQNSNSSSFGVIALQNDQTLAHNSYIGSATILKKIPFVSSNSDLSWERNREIYWLDKMQRIRSKIFEFDHNLRHQLC